MWCIYSPPPTQSASVNKTLTFFSSHPSHLSSPPSTPHPNTRSVPLWSVTVASDLDRNTNDAWNKTLFGWKCDPLQITVLTSALPKDSKSRLKKKNNNQKKKNQLLFLGKIEQKWNCPKASSAVWQWRVFAALLSAQLAMEMAASWVQDNKCVQVCGHHLCLRVRLASELCHCQAPICLENVV